MAKIPQATEQLASQESRDKAKLKLVSRNTFLDVVDDLPTAGDMRRSRSDPVISSPFAESFSESEASTKRQLKAVDWFRKAAVVPVPAGSPHVQEPWRIPVTCKGCEMIGPSPQTGPGGCTNCKECGECCKKRVVCPKIQPEFPIASPIEEHFRPEFPILCGNCGTPSMNVPGTRATSTVRMCHSCSSTVCNLCMAHEEGCCLECLKTFPVSQRTSASAPSMYNPVMTPMPSAAWLTALANSGQASPVHMPLSIPRSPMRTLGAPSSPKQGLSASAFPSVPTKAMYIGDAQVMIRGGSIKQAHASGGFKSYGPFQHNFSDFGVCYFPEILGDEAFTSIDFTKIIGNEDGAGLSVTLWARLRSDDIEVASEMVHMFVDGKKFTECSVAQESFGAHAQVPLKVMLLPNRSYLLARTLKEGRGQVAIKCDANLTGIFTLELRSEARKQGASSSSVEDGKGAAAEAKAKAAEDFELAQAASPAALPQIRTLHNAEAALPVRQVQKQTHEQFTPLERHRSHRGDGRAWSRVVSIDGAAMIDVPEDCKSKHVFSARLVNEAEQDTLLVDCPGDMCSRMYELSPAGIAFEYPVVVRLAPVPSTLGGECACGAVGPNLPCLDAVRMLRREDLDAEWEVLDSFVEDGFVCATLHSFCYVILICCFPYASMLWHRVGGRIDVKVKLHTSREQGLTSEPAGPISVILTNFEPYQVSVLERHSQLEETVTITWLHMDGVALAPLAFLGMSATEPFFDVKIGGKKIACDVQEKGYVPAPWSPETERHTAEPRSKALSSSASISVDSLARLSENKRTLQRILSGHEFKPYSCEQIDVLVKVITAYVENPADRYKNFGGLSWIFIREKVHALPDVINWTSSFCHCAIDFLPLVSFWGSTDADAHDAAGVFGCYKAENQLLSVGVIVKCDLEELFSNVDVQEFDRNRTGYTSSAYMALVTGAVVLKVSEKRSIKLFYKSDAEGFCQRDAEVKTLHQQLSQVLGRS